jgi:hypothetical protein
VAAQLATSQEGLSAMNSVHGIGKKTFRENVKIAPRESLRYYQLKQHKP